MNLYFAYGSNMWREQMNLRCPGHRYFGYGILKGFRWIITKRGYANIVKSDPDEIHGVVYKITEENEKSLDKHEGVLNGSYQKHVLSIDIEKTRYNCLVYIDPITEEGIPKEEYVDRIIKGIADADLYSEYVDRSIRKYLPMHMPGY